MRVTRSSEAPTYAAALHRGVLTRRLQGHEAGPTDRFWIGLSTYQPGGAAEKSTAPEETVYVILDGELVITADGAEAVLGQFDSAHIAKGGLRSIENRSDREAVLLVAIAHPRDAWS